MKKLLFVAGIAAACSAFADTISGTTEIGMLTVNNSTSHDCIVAVPFTELATGEAICVSNIVKTANLTKGDELYVYDDNGWTAWVLQENGDAKYWQSVGEASIGNDGNPTHGTTPEASTQTLVTGKAIWLKRANPAGPFYLYGGFKQALSTETTAEVYNLIANPLDTAYEFAGATKGDSVLRVNSTGSKTTTTRYRWNGTQWGYMNATGGMEKVGATLTIPAGEGVWYSPKAARTINWRGQ